ncbi:hypothetical protein CYG49_02660, partial [Candidatus Saccharibacteria bacterium]
KIGGFVTPKITDTIQPAFNATVLILIALGILRAFADFHATRTYTLLIWTAIILPIVALQQQFIAVLYLPAILFLAIGVQTLIREWYSIFPLNPYARLAGLLPLIALIVGVGYLNYVNYFMGFRYSSLASTYFDDSLRTLNQSLKDERYTKGSVVVVVPNNKVSFFSMLQEEGKDLRVEISNSVAVTPNTSYFVDSRSMLPPDTAAALGTPKDFVVSSKKNNDLRWRVYQK